MEQINDGVLTGSWTYLSGAIDFAKDHGTSWREEITPKLKAMGIKIIDPTKKPGDVVYESEQHIINKYKQQEEWDKITEIAKGFRRLDLRYTDLSDFIIVYIDTGVFSFGTIDEILTAEDQHKPIFAIVKGGKKNAPSWLFAIADWRNEIFNNIDECVEHISKIHSGQILLSDKWVLIRDKM